MTLKTALFRILVQCIIKFVYYSVKESRVNDAWIGLTKTQHNCGSSPSLDCLRRGWAWSDETPYDYDDGFQDWFDDSNNEPSSSELCARIRQNAWYGIKCSGPYGYICEKGNYE